MGRRPSGNRYRQTSILIDPDDLDKARELGLNVSETFRNYLKTLMYGDVAIEKTPELMSHVHDFAKIALINSNWVHFLSGRRNRIVNLTGIKLGIAQLKLLVEQEVEKIKKENENDE